MNRDSGKQNSSSSSVVEVSAIGGVPGLIYPEDVQIIASS